MRDKYFAQRFKSTTFLITGATGMIGQNVIRVLMHLNDCYNAEIQVIAHAQNEQKVKTIFQNEYKREDFKTVISNITNLEITDDVDFIIHTAGVTGGSKQHIDFPMRTISIALEGTKRVLDIALEKKSKGVVYLSSLEVYGNTGFDKEKIAEDDGGYINPVNVRSSYSESKRMCECMCASYTKQYGIPTYIARLTATFGKGVSYQDNRVFSQFAKSIIENKDIVLKSTGETVRNYCDAEDAARAFLVMLVNGEAGSAYNVANMDTEVSIKELALKFIELFPESGTQLVFDLDEDVKKLGYNATMRNVLDADKLMKIGWKPLVDMDEMIKRLVLSMKEDFIHIKNK